jgi:hypothetical protein
VDPPPRQRFDQDRAGTATGRIRLPYRTDLRSDLRPSPGGTGSSIRSCARHWRETFPPDLVYAGATIFVKQVYYGLKREAKTP